MPSDNNENWNNNTLQFARLISEGVAAGAFSEEVIDDMAKSMGLTAEDVDELLERAQTEYDEFVAKL
jgi:hypothetical protein